MTEKPTITMGIDQSISCSAYFVLSQSGDIIAHNTVMTPPAPDELAVFRRSIEIATTLVNAINEHGVTDLAIEGLAMGKVKGNSSRDLAILQGIIISSVTDKTKLTLNDIILPSPKTVKKYATGSGNAGKIDMFNALPDSVREIVGAKYKITKGRYDISDAYFIASFAIQKKHSNS
jgi:Holliday junction resolvasome RuvABC endonuclease subunit